MISTLTLKIATDAPTEGAKGDAPPMRVHVIPVIDGQPYITDYVGYPFEALGVYAMDMQDGEVWAFNCECGMPSCARIEEPMKLTVDATTVRWELPDEPFVELATNQDGTAKPRQFVFDRARYESAFQGLIEKLRSLEEENGGIRLHPAGNRRPTLDREIECERSWAEYRRIRRAALRDLDHPDVEFVVMTPQGLELATELSTFVYEVTRPFLSAGIYDLPKAREALTRLGDDLRVDPRILLRQLDVQQLSRSLRATNVGFSDDDGDDPDKWPAPYWTGPDSPKTHVDFWINVQQAGVASLRKRLW